MTDASRRTTAVAWEFGALIGLVFVMPLFEAPKNILGVLFFAFWLFNRVRAGDFAGAWGRWDSFIAGLIAVAIIESTFSGLKFGEWLGLRDVVRSLLLLWCLSRCEYSQRQWTLLLVALVAGTVVASAQAAWRFAGSDLEGLELNSVGHANHSATYLCTVFGVVLAMLAGAWRDWTAGQKLALLAAAAVLALATIATGSRIAVLCLAGVALLIGVMQARRSWVPLAAMVSAVVVAAVLLTTAEPWALKKHLRNVNNDNVLAYRDQLWERAFTAWRAYPVFGIGMDNFSQITSERYRQWTEAQGRTFDATRDFTSSHAHSLYFDALAERGAVGAVALLAFLAAWGASLWRRRPRVPDVQAETVWGAAAAALFVTMFIGLVNTTLHNELAGAAMMCLGAWLAWCRRPR